MNRIAYSILTGSLVAMVGFAPVGSLAAADAKAENKAAQVRAKSALPVEAPLLGRIVVTPTPEQMAKIRIERRMIRLENRAAAGEKACKGQGPCPL
jgi:hypothetical protein